jgi:hypothetical protein
MSETNKQRFLDLIKQARTQGLSRASQDRFYEDDWTIEQLEANFTDLFADWQKPLVGNSASYLVVVSCSISWIHETFYFAFSVFKNGVQIDIHELKLDATSDNFTDALDTSVQASPDSELAELYFDDPALALFSAEKLQYILDNIQFI